MKQFFKLLTAVMILSLLLSACVKLDAVEPEEQITENIEEQTAENTSEESSGILSESEVTTENSYDFSKDIIAANYDTDGATLITLKNTFAEISGEGATAENSVITINSAGVYVISGVLSDGQIIIDATKNDCVNLVLNGVSIYCANSAPIYCKQADKTIITLADGSVNELTDGSEYLFPEGVDEPNATLFSKDDLTLSGEGKLIINANFKNGIASKDDLCILSGEYVVAATHDAIRGNDLLAIDDGIFELTAGNDGLKSNNETDEGAGCIIINNGNFKITAGHDGIDSANALTINGGNFDIFTGEGSAAAPIKVENGFMGGGGWNWGGGTTTPQATNEDDSTSDSYKALKSNQNLIINEGTFVIDSYDDAVHSNANVTINGGNLTINAGDDGIHGDKNITITSGIITIEKSYEGIESQTIDINGGIISITASDDGFNASDGSGVMGMRTGGNSSLYIRTTGGEINIKASADGIDSNGNIFFEGGNIFVTGSSDPESAIDADGTISVSGGTIVGIGSTGHMESPTANSAQPTIMIIFSSQQSAGTIVKLINKDGTVLFEGTSEKVFQSFLFSDPALILGEEYTLYVNGVEKTKITLSTAMTTCSETGGAVSSNNRGMGGGGGGRVGR